jgi:NADH dehydrogenase FAD-containing subunit
MEKKHVVILGAGFAGLELATRLSASLAHEVRVTLIDRNITMPVRPIAWPGFSRVREYRPALLL